MSRSMLLQTAYHLRKLFNDAEDCFTFIFWKINNTHLHDH